MPICLNLDSFLEPQMQVATSWGKPSLGQCEYVLV